MARPLTSLRSVCSRCGAVYERTRESSQCLECRPPRPPERRTARRRERERERGSATARGYGAHWQALSEQARYLQPWCSDCGTDRDLTGDHSPEAWARHAAGKPVRLEDIDVVCRSCNGRRGDARDAGSSDAHPTMGDGRRRLEAEAEALADVHIDGDEVGTDEALARLEDQKWL